MRPCVVGALLRPHALERDCAGRRRILRSGQRRENSCSSRDSYGATAAGQRTATDLGRRGTSSANAYRLDLPFFLVPVFFPLGLIADPNSARGVWATMAQLSLISSTLLCARLVDWQVPCAWLLPMGLLALVSYPTYCSRRWTARPFWCSSSWRFSGSSTGNDELAGALTVMALCKWEVGLPFLLLVTLAHRSGSTMAHRGRFRE